MERLLDILQRPSPRLGHIRREHPHRAQRQRAKQKIDTERGCLQEHGREQRDEEVRSEAQAHRDAVRRGARVPRLDLAGVDLADDAPGRAVREPEDEHGDDDQPARDPVRVHDARRVQAAHEEHAAGEREAAADGGGAAAPFVGEQEGGDGDGEHEDGGEAGGEEGGVVG